MEEGSDVDVIYLDFSKAFDKVDIGILLCKLRALGIREPLFGWIQDFLTGRRQRVTVNGHLSRWSPVVSGVPQGTLLGPILFLAHITDIGVGTTSAVSCFADDTRITRPVPTREQADYLQRDLEKIYSWATKGNMSFNDDKFRVLHYNVPGGEPREERMYQSPDGEAIKNVPDIKDLGVIMTEGGGFEAHIEMTVRKARQMMGWLLRTFSTRNPIPMLILYKAIVLPHLEYGCQVWSPVSLGNIRKLEYVQRSFTSRLDGLQDLNYWNRLSRLSLYSLERRRERYLVIYVWKVLRGLAPMIMSRQGDEIKLRESARRGQYCSIPAVNNRAPAAVRSSIERSLPVQGARLFNSLPKHLREFRGSLAAFKNGLDQHLKNVPDRPYLPHYYMSELGNSLLAHS